MPTIIGAESFHGPVRDGKGWFQLAVVVRHDLSPGKADCVRSVPDQFGSGIKKYSVLGCSASIAAKTGCVVIQGCACTVGSVHDRLAQANRTGSVVW